MTIDLTTRELFYLFLLYAVLVPFTKGILTPLFMDVYSYLRGNIYSYLRRDR